MRFEPIAVIGMGAVSPLGVGIDSLWSGLLACDRPFRRYSAAGVESCRVGIAAEVSAPLERSASSRSIDFGVVAAREALRAAFCDPQRQRIGVVMGSTAAGDAAVELALSKDTTDAVGQASLLRASNKGLLVNELCFALGVRGPRQSINTACSSGANAIALVCDGLQMGDFEIGLAIGCDEISRFTFSGFHALRALDPNPCRPFDRARRGMTLGEGAGCLVLQRLSDARRGAIPVLGCVVGVGVSCDAHHLTAPDPEGHGAALAIQRALATANLEIEDLGFINAHGTGTPLNDAAEVAGLQRALGEFAARCPLHSAKASTGHCLGAAGAIEAIVALLSLRSGLVPATAGLSDCEFDGLVDCVRDRPRSVCARYGLSNSFGFGGNNTSLVLSRPECSA
jgi:3-oxoacyl-[acyl-carrier-protein] synthase II